MRAKTIDWGSYVRYDGKITIPFDRLVQNGLCDIFITKGGQSGPGLSTKANLAASKAAGVLVNGCFYWEDPCNSVDYDTAHICALVEEENPDIIILDIEQWWSDWQKYEDAINKLIPWSDVPHFTSDMLSNHYREVSLRVRASFPDKKVLIYTSKPFVLSWAGPMKAWISEFDGGFVASWPDYGKTIYYLDWPDIQAYPPADAVPDLPPGWTTWKLWQTSSRIRPLEYQGTLDGFDHNMDWGVFNGTVDELRAWAGLAPVVPPDPPPPAELSDHERIVNLETWAAGFGYKNYIPIAQKPG